MGNRQLCTYMCEVMSSSGVVVGVHGTWCAAWDGVFVPCPLVFTVYKRCGARWCCRGTTLSIIRRTEGRAVNWYTVKLGAIWCNTNKFGQVVLIPVCCTMHYLAINQVLHYALSC